MQINELYETIKGQGQSFYATGWKGQGTYGYMPVIAWRYRQPSDLTDNIPQVATFPLENIDKMRENILAATKITSAFLIQWEGSVQLTPYDWAIQIDDSRYTSVKASQEGLALKTYQSDLFNNWLSSEWIGGDTGVSAVTAVDTSDGEFTIDTLNLKSKLYDMLNRIAVSGGSYDDWIDAVYDHQAYRRAESPIYHGGLIKELIFQEVVSSAASTDGNQPLGQLAGKGRLSGKHKGGDLVIKVDEPSYIIGLVSLTPRIDYSQGNKWDVNLKTMDDFHKPALDEIGFQDLITDQMAWWDTTIDSANNIIFRSAGKQPAWINYQTNVNRVFGNFAIEGNEMFMTLNRRYERSETTGHIKDLTTYIDPAKYNNVFADTARDAQNFWTQIGVNMTARRKMSASIMPNL